MGRGCSTQHKQELQARTWEQSSCFPKMSFSYCPRVLAPSCLKTSFLLPSGYGYNMLTRVSLASTLSPSQLLWCMSALWQETCECKPAYLPNMVWFLISMTRTRTSKSLLAEKTLVAFGNSKTVFSYFKLIQGLHLAIHSSSEMHS